MLNTTFINEENLILQDIISFFAIKTIILGLITFLFFFLLLRALDKQGYTKIVIRNINRKWEIIKHGNAILLVRDGVLQLDKLYTANITTQQIYTALRSKKISNLSEVERLFLIPGGEFSIHKKKGSNEGLPVFEYSDKQILGVPGEA